LRLPERILLHLFESGGANLENTKDIPLQLTQAGMVSTFGCSLERVSTSLNELMEAGLVAKKRFYWRETGRFRNFYILTQEGKNMAQELLDELMDRKVKILTPEGLLKESTLEDLVEFLSRSIKASGQTAYELKEKKYPEPTYTNILLHLTGDTFDVKSFLTPRGAEINRRTWDFVRDAYFDSTHNYVVLTRNKHWQAGIVWLREGVKSPFIAEFRFKAGGGSGGDGLVFMFYKRKDYWPADGGNLGFVPGVGNMPGYGVEFDSQPNPDYNDPLFPHIALIKDTPMNHLAYVEDRRVSDFIWHAVRIAVGESSVRVEVDGKKVLSWEGEISRAHSGIGISASTGGMTNWHIVDDVKIMKQGPDTGRRVGSSPKIKQKMGQRI
jgi:DNA-binding PadR family transcriptional regulator